MPQDRRDVIEVLTHDHREVEQIPSPVAPLRRAPVGASQNGDVRGSGRDRCVPAGPAPVWLGCGFPTTCATSSRCSPLPSQGTVIQLLGWL